MQTLRFLERVGFLSHRPRWGISDGEIITSLAPAIKARRCLFTSRHHGSISKSVEVFAVTTRNMEMYHGVKIPE